MSKPIDSALFDQASCEVRHSHTDADTFINETLYHLCPTEREELAELISSFGQSANLNESAAHTIEKHPLVVKRTIELILKIGNYHALDVAQHINENGLDEAA